MKKITFLTIILCSMGLFLKSCSTIPPGAVAVTSFDKEKYLGKWYEIARFDFRFEKNLNNTTAFYSLREDGFIKVQNRGYNNVTNEWQESIGKAKFVGDPTVAMLKVSFFGPFYGGYNVIALDDEYKYALIAGNSLKYLWILAREKTIPEEIKIAYLKKAQEIGFDTDKLIWVEHD